jgi:hypothetical protein
MRTSVAVVQSTFCFVTVEWMTGRIGKNLHEFIQWLAKVIKIT